ncbi:hypothetical protein Tco_1175441 [Tanacetum coccineum]
MIWEAKEEHQNIIEITSKNMLFHRKTEQVDVQNMDDVNIDGVGATIPESNCCPTIIEENKDLLCSVAACALLGRSSRLSDIVVKQLADDRTFTSQAWNMLFRILEQVVREYVMEFLSSFTFRENIMDLDNDDTMIFQLGGIRRSRYSGKEKVTLDDLFLLHCMDGGAKVDVPWHAAKFFTDKAKGYKKKSPETSLFSVAKLVDMGICKYNGLGYGEMVDDLPDNGKDEAAKAGVGEGQDDDGGVRRRPNMTFSNRLRAMDERLGDIQTNISTLSTEVDDLTYVQSVNFMSNTPVYSTAPSSSPNLFGLFGDANTGPSTSQNQGKDMDEE